MPDARRARYEQALHASWMGLHHVWEASFDLQAYGAMADIEQIQRELTRLLDDSLKQGGALRTRALLPRPSAGTPTHGSRKHRPPRS
jgi:hypothetical protein